MSEQEQVVALINNILQSSDNTLRANNEVLLGAMTESKIGELAMALINILKSDEKEGVKQFAITHLRKHLSTFSDGKFKSVWGKISEDNQKNIRNSLFECIGLEKDASTRNMIADSIGQIAGTVMSVNTENWPGFVQSLKPLLHDSRNELIVAGLIILENFFGFCPDLFAKEYGVIIPIIQQSFTHENNKIKSAGLKAFSAYILSIDKSGVSKLQPLIIPFYEVIYHLLVNDKGNSDGLQALSDLVQMQPKTLKKSFNQLFKLIENIIKIKDIEAGVKKMGTQILISFAQRYPALYRQDKEKIAGLIEILFYHMIEIDQQIDEEWKKPPEGYSQDFQQNDDFETTTFGMTSVDRLIAAIGQKQMLPLLSIAVQKMLTMSDWRYKFASIMALSQTGQYIEDASSIKSIVDMLLNFLGNENPMLRFASCHAIGQISDDLKPHYQQHYGKQTFLRLAALLKDSVPRVVSHSASALTNLIQGMKYDDIAQYLPQLIGALLELSTTGISLVKQSALTTIASIAQICKLKYLPYFQKTSQILFTIVQTHPGKQYKQLKGLVIEALTSIAESLGKQHFKPVAPNLIEYLITVQDSQLEQVDPQKQYILGGWQRLCTVFGKDIAPYLPRILPGLFKLIEQVIESTIKSANFQNILTSQENNQKDDGKINTYQTQEAQISIAMLNIFLKQMGQFFVPYIEKTTKIMISIVQSQINQSVKQQAYQSLPLIISLLKSSNLETSINYTKNFLKILTQKAMQQYDTDIQIANLRSTKQIIELYDTKFLTIQELNDYSDKVIKILVDSDKRKDETKGLKETDDLEDEEKQLLNEQIVMEEEVQVALSEIFGQLFKTHKEMNAKLIDYIMKNLLPKTLGDNATDIMNKFGIFLIDDMVEFLGYGLIEGIWPGFHPIFLKFCLHKNLSVRQAACYGLGIYAKNTPASAFIPYIQNSIKTLIQSADIPKGSQSQKTFGNCRDNAISSFGKIIKYHGSSFDPKPSILVWVNYLPLKYDQGQAHLQHQFLTDIINNSVSLLISNQGQQSANVLLKILQIFGDIIQTKYTTPSITTKIKQNINTIKALPLFVSHYDAFWSKLTETQAVKLTAIVKQ